MSKRDLSAVEAELLEVLKREAADIIRAGQLLIEAKAQIPHGEWAAWLDQRFSLSDRSAQRYMAAYRFAVKYDIVADLNMSPSALYLLVEEDFGAGVISACVELSGTKRVGKKDVWECYRLLRNAAEQSKDQFPKSGPLPGPTEAEKREAHQRWVENGKPTFDAEQEAEQKRAAQHAQKIALQRLKEEIDTWLPRMKPEERKEALRYLTEKVAQQELPLAPAPADQSSATPPKKIVVNGKPMDIGRLGPAARYQIATAIDQLESWKAATA
jgi:Protein of unknown function (DUF3102)